MTKKKQAVIIILLWVTAVACGQGNFVYDQQSSTNETPFSRTGRVIQEYAPLGQSFTPSLAGVDFIRLKLYDNNTDNGLGAILYLNLRSDSITGSILQSTTFVTLSNGFAGTIDFSFPETVAVIPGIPYFFEPIVESGDSWRIDVGEYNYPGGNTISMGVPLPGSDIWFREGLIVPEPSGGSLLLLALLIAKARRWLS